MSAKNELLIQERISKAIYLIRNQKVLLDSELAEMYGVEIKRLNEQVKRNLDRFPEDFMFQLNEDEWQNLKTQFETSNESDSLRSQIATLESGRGKHRKYLPFVFT